MTKPTEARQDELAGVKDDLETILYNCYNEKPVDIDGTFLHNFRDYADQILSLPVSSGGICPECKGECYIPRIATAGGYDTCPTCSSTGSVKKEEISIGDLIKEWKERR